MITSMDHLAIAVPNLERAMIQLTEDFGFSFSDIEEVANQQVRTSFFAIDESHIELVEPTSQNTALARFIDKRQGGIHHICFKSNDLDSDVAMLKAKNYQFTTDDPFIGAKGKRCIFIHPNSCFGVLVEINQE